MRGTILSNRYLVDEALALYEEALEVAQDLGDPFIERPLLNNVGALYAR